MLKFVITGRFFFFSGWNRIDIRSGCVIGQVSTRATGKIYQQLQQVMSALKSVALNQGPLILGGTAVGTTLAGASVLFFLLQSDGPAPDEL